MAEANDSTHSADYQAEFQELVDQRGELEYEEQNPFLMTYIALADMVVLCTRLYVGMRSAEVKVAKMLQERDSSEPE